MQNKRTQIPPRNRRTYAASHAVRLADCNYSANIDVHVTICAANGRPFSDATTAAMVCENVDFYAKKLGYRLYGYCLMPDHLHVLLSPGASGLAVGRWLREFKSFTTRSYQKLAGPPVLWQRSAHDHVCRIAETAETVLVYIINNPVRAGLVERYDDWPWTKVYIDL
jgi:REP element-mobilizing transposase RayT